MRAHFLRVMIFIGIGGLIGYAIYLVNHDLPITPGPMAYAETADSAPPTKVKGVEHVVPDDEFVLDCMQREMEALIAGDQVAAAAIRQQLRDYLNPAKEK